MITEVCAEVNNWFDRDMPKYIGMITVDGTNKTITVDGDEISIVTNQYYRIQGSLFNNGVKKHGNEPLVNETFYGSVWLLAIPDDFVSLVAEISDWQIKYGGVDSQAMSPFSGENFDSYGYTKATPKYGASISWSDVYESRLRRYRKA